MSVQPPNPSGLCMCGCGGKTWLARQNDPKAGWVAGQPVRYVRGHHLYKSSVEYIVDDNGCWIWQRGISSTGYGSIGVNGKTANAHRVYYERRYGKVPDGLHLDHLCRVRACVNPDHLEPVTCAENIARSPIACKQTHCRRGHEFTPENTYARPDTGARTCVQCRRDRRKARDAERRASRNL